MGMPKTPYMRTEDIEAATLGLLADYGRKYKPVLAPPVPVEGILEGYLELTLDFDDLPRRLRIPDALGATWLQMRQVVIDQSLDPTGSPSKEGRYRFTLAHEIAHWELHRRLFLTDPAQASLFGEEQKPSIVCRTGSRKEPMEWQADSFSGFLLMPKDMILRSWETRTGGRDAYVAETEIKGLASQWGLADDIRPTVEIARTMAADFRVSGQAMQIRLVGLGLIKTEQPPPDLFNATSSVNSATGREGE